jgi:GNAT superfamily N-acetyltransferase
LAEILWPQSEQMRALELPAKLTDERVRLRMMAPASSNPLAERALPAGFRIVCYGEAVGADASGWARAIVGAGERANEAEALAQFRAEFASFDAQTLRERMFFALDSSGAVAGTATAWFFGESQGGGGRVHWVSVVPAAQGRGLSKSLLAVVLRRLRDLHGESRPIGLVTHTQAARAIAMYIEVGFRPCALDEQLGAFTEEERAGWERLAERGVPISLAQERPQPMPS